MKGQRGMSRLLEIACKEAKSGYKDLVNQVRHIENKFLNAVEISAQEAVYLVFKCHYHIHLDKCNLSTPLFQMVFAQTNRKAARHA